MSLTATEVWKQIKMYSRSLSKANRRISNLDRQGERRPEVKSILKRTIKIKRLMKAKLKKLTLIQLNLIDSTSEVQIADLSKSQSSISSTVEPVDPELFEKYFRHVRDGLGFRNVHHVALGAAYYRKSNESHQSYWTARMFYYSL